MVIRWLLAFTLSLQVTFAIAAERTDYRDWDKTRPQVVDRWDSKFDGTKKQAEYLKNYASGRMDTMISQINNEHKVRTMIRDSGYDPDTGKKIRIEANVTQTANKAKVASTLVDRLGKAKDYAKHVGKASIPSFVGTAAFHGLMGGIGWVMDEGGKVTKHPNSDDIPYDDPSQQYYYQISYGSPSTKYSSIASLCSEAFIRGGWNDGKPGNGYSCVLEGSRVVATTPWGGSMGQMGSRVDNPSYNPSAPSPESVEATPEQLAEALKNALESNNPALAAAIAEAIKAAYTPEGPLLASIGDEQANGLAVDAADTARDAVNKASKNTGSEPSSKGKPGYYNITDGDKTIEGNVYETDPTGSITPKPDTGTGTEPGTGTGTGTSTGGATLEFPVFCEWAGIVCDFIDWVKQDEEIPEDEPEKIDESIFDRKFDINFDMGGSCPPNPTWSFEFVGQQWSKEINISSICDFFRYIGYAIVFASNMTALWIVYAAVTVREQG